MTNTNTDWIEEPVIYGYFLKLNREDFSGVCRLFAKQGCLHAPFTKAICGRKAIYNYLQAEAGGMIAIPQSCSVESSPNGSSKYQLKGKVQTQLFTVNVGWTIELNESKEILSVVVTLLAELQELLGLRT